MGIQSVVCRVAVVVATCVASFANATTSQRTFVASNGVDTNACSRTQPCRGFAAAMIKTSPGGEVVVLDAAGYGPVVITQSVSIVAPQGVYAGVSVLSGTGISVNAAAIKVRIQGLTINAQAANLHGIDFYDGAELVVENCEISGMLLGITASSASGKLVVRNSVFLDNGYGINTNGPVAVVVDGAAFYSNGSAVNGSGGQINISNSVLARSTFTGVLATAAPYSVQIVVSHCILTGNDTTFAVAAASGLNASIVSDANEISYTNLVFNFGGSGGSEGIYTRTNNTVGYYNFLITGGSLTTLGPI